MKNIFKSVLVAAAAMALAFCSKDEPVAPAPASGLRINVVASSSRTVFDTDNVKWSGDEEMALFVNGVHNHGNAVADIQTSGQAAFMFETNITEPGMLKLQGVIPASAMLGVKISDKDHDNAGVLQMELKSAQAATVASFDPAADILVSRDCDREVTQEDLEVGIIDAEFYFGRLMAITRYAVTNSRADVSADEVVESVQVELETADGNAKKGLTGRFYFDISKGLFVNNSDERVDATQNPFYANQSFNYVSIDYPEESRPTLGELKIWTVTAPVTMEAGDKLVFTIKTDRNTIVKTSTLKAPISLVATSLNTSTVKIADNETCVVTPVEKPSDDLKTATLTQEEIASISDHGYSHETFTNSFGEWAYYAYKNKASGTHYLQVNKSSYYIATPKVNGVIKSVEITNNSTKNAVYLNTSASMTNPIATCDATNYTSATLVPNVDVDQVYIVGGNIQITSITVYYEESTDPKISVAETDKVQNIPAAGDVVTVPFTTANLTGEVTVSCDAAWAHDFEVSETGVTFIVDASDLATERKAVLTIESEADGVSAEVTLVQAAFAPELSVAETSLTVDAGGVELKQIKVASADLTEAIAVSVTPAAAADWLTADYNKTDGTLDIMVAPNEDAVERTATVTLSSSGVSATVEVKQAGKSDFASKLFDFTNMSYDHGSSVTSETQIPIEIAFDKGTNTQNDPKYYTNSKGNAIRVYTGNTVTVSGGTITQIDITYGNTKGGTTTANPSGTFTDATANNTAVWKGSATSVTFTFAGTTWISSIKVTYAAGGDIPSGPIQLATPEVTATSTATSVTLTWKAVDHADSYMYSIGDEMGETTATSVTVDNLSAGDYSWSVIACTNDKTNYTDSDEASGTVTVTASAVVDPAVAVDADKWTPAAGGETKEFAVTLTATDTYTVETPDWITVDEHTAAALKLTASANETGAERTGTVTLTVSNGKTATIAVSQNKVGAEKYYVKVTDAADVTNGKYLIVFNDNKAHGAVSSKDLIASTGTLTIDGDKIVSDDASDAGAVEISEKAIILTDGKYLSASKNSCGTSTSPVSFTFEYTATGMKITNGSYTLQLNGSQYFRFYAMNSSYKLPDLYKLQE